jgi:hypothetical protein
MTIRVEDDDNYAWLAIELLAVAVGWMPIDGNYFEHISWMMEALLSAFINNINIPGNEISLNFIVFQLAFHNLSHPFTTFYHLSLIFIAFHITFH